LLGDKLPDRLSEPGPLDRFYRFSQDRNGLKNTLKLPGAAPPPRGLQVQLIPPIALFDNRNKVNDLDASAIDIVK